MSKSLKLVDALVESISATKDESKWKAKAREYIEWESNDFFRGQVEKAMKENDLGTLREMFAKRISFGTAGLRGAMSGGYGYMNDLIIVQTSQGICKWAEAHVKNAKEKGVVIGNDARRNSARFGQLAARVFGEYGFKVYLFNRFAATPLIPVALQMKGAAIGIVVTASHNPAKDNGFKVYAENGAQIISPTDTQIQKAIIANLKPWKSDYKPLYLSEASEEKSDRVVDVTREVTEKYLGESVARYSFTPDLNRKHAENDKLLKVVFTAMHGVGGFWMKRCVDAFGLPPFIPVPSQIEPDPDFPTVSFPNPEEAGALKLAYETADANGAKLILANDPDSDRLAVAEKNEKTGTWFKLNGNDIAMLFADWALSQHMRKHPSCDKSKLFMCASAVSSKWLASFAKKNGFGFHATLTGFKWIGNKIIEMLEKKQGHVFLFAYEVEIGFCFGDLSVDKDGLRCACIFNELALHLYRNGKTCASRIHELRAEYGFFEMENKYIFVDDSELMVKFDRIRNGGDYPKAMGPFKITRVRDVTTGFDSGEADLKCALPLQPNSQMISFWFANEATLTLRNSGTEPKLKYYVEARHSESKEGATKIVKEMVRVLLETFLS